MTSSQPGERPPRKAVPDTLDLPDTFEPYEESRRIPLPVFWIAIALAIWGGVTLWDNARAVGVGRHERTEQIRAMPAMALNSGGQIFEARCSTCHQPNAVGVRTAIPPLAGSRFVTAQPSVVVQILLHGIDGPIDVEGHTFNGHMPGFASVLSDAELARVATHVRRTWGNDRREITPAFVTAQRQRFPDREPWRGGEELARVVDPAVGPQPGFVATAKAFAVDPDLMPLVADGRGQTWACSSCHGAAGQGGGNVPRLAGLPEGYIIKQLQDYVAGRRRNETMKMVADTLTDADRRGLARYYSSLRTPSTARPGLGGNIARGEQLALHGDWSRNLPACFSCHGPSGFGVAPSFPSLAAQHPAYTASQLSAWVGGGRANSEIDLMNQVARNLSDADRRAVADYLATLPPVPALQREQGNDYGR